MSIQWTASPPKARRQSKYKYVLEAVRSQQIEHPGAWAEIRRFPSGGTARDLAWRLRKETNGFQFRSQLDQDTREGVVYARYVGGEDE